MNLVFIVNGRTILCAYMYSHQQLSFSSYWHAQFNLVTSLGPLLHIIWSTLGHWFGLKLQVSCSKRYSKLLVRSPMGSRLHPVVSLNG